MTIIANLLKNNENHRKSIKTAIQKPDFLRRNEKINGNRALERFSYMFREGGRNPIFLMKIKKSVTIIRNHRKSPEVIQNHCKIIKNHWKTLKIMQNHIKSLQNH